ncbi:hypothetical protein ACROYT_G015117 [Oculina patagonica]
MILQSVCKSEDTFQSYTCSPVQKEKKETHPQKKAFLLKSKRLKDGEKELCQHDAYKALRIAVVECEQCEESDNSTLSGLQAMEKAQHDTDKMDKILSKLKKLEFIASEIKTL